MILARVDNLAALALTLPLGLALAGFVLTTAAWVALHLLPTARRGRAWRIALGLGRLGVGTACLLLAAAVLDSWLLLTTDWPVGLLAILGAASVETVCWLYRLERRTVSRRAGVAMTALRTALVLLVVALLAQPVRQWQLRQEDLRYIVVLLDDSGSMHLADNRLDIAEKLRLARVFQLDVPPRPYRFQQLRRQLEQTRTQLAGLDSQLTQARKLPRDRRDDWLRSNRQAIHEQLTEIRGRLDTHLQAVRAPMDDQSLDLPNKQIDALGDLASRLRSAVRDAVDRAARITQPDRADQLGRQDKALASNVASGLENLAPLGEKLSTLGEKIDEAFFQSLPEDQRKQIEQLAGKTRAAIAAAAIAQPGQSDEDPSASLLDLLGQTYELKIYRFADQVRQVEPAQAARAPAPRPPAAGTDLAGALEQVLAELPVQQLSGVLILSDGRSTSRKPLEPLAEKLALAEVPVIGGVLGSTRSPVDAAIVSVQAPEQVAPSDRVSVQAEISLEGLAGKEVRVRLLDEAEPVDEKTIQIPAGSFRATVQLSDEPKSDGLHAYRLEISSFDGEVLSDNNARQIPVIVRKDRAKLLLIEGRPRWEFRYLKNLFADRDETVHLQYLLLQPDRIALDKKTDEQAEKQEPVPASATAKEDRVEATALPGTVTEAMSPEQRAEEIRAEWLKFDTVVLGDVDPADLRSEDHEALADFVNRRGGTLIVIAGPEHVPHRWAEQPLGELLPVRFKTAEEIRTELQAHPDKSRRPKKDQPLPIAQDEEAFRMQPTAEGLAHEITRQEETAEANREAWQQFPEVYWRHPYMSAKPSARVLLFAMPTETPELFGQQAARDAAESPAARREWLARRRQFQADNALVTVQNVGHGRVLFLSFDRTWRMRYRIGDTRHHKFWGQVMRWAHADRLSAGSRHVRLGTDRPRYQPGQPVRVQAQLLDEQFAPVLDAEVQAKVFDAEGRLRRRVQMPYLPDSPGRYSAQLAPLEPGSWRIELDSERASALLGSDDQYTDRGVSVRLAVAADTPEEMIDLAAEPGGLALLASATNGRILAGDEVPTAAGLMGPPSQVHVETNDYRIWDSWPLLVLILAVAAAEWLTRKKAGLP